MNQITETINSANLSCAKGTECYDELQINDALNKYNAAVITNKNAPAALDAALKNYLITSKGAVQANQYLMQRYEKNGEDEKKRLTQEFDNWFNDINNKISTLSQNMQTTHALSVSNRNITNRLNDLLNQTNDSVNHLNLFERKIHFTGQVVQTINKVEYYIKLIYWLAFFTWIACIIYDRELTMKTGGLFVLFTVIVLMQDQIMDSMYSFYSVLSNLL